jgi:hypothetical protein
MGIVTYPKQSGRFTESILYVVATNELKERDHFIDVSKVYSFIQH